MKHRKILGMLLAVVLMLQLVAAGLPVTVEAEGTADGCYLVRRSGAGEHGGL